MFRVARALTRLGPEKTMEGFVGFTTGLNSSSSKNTNFRCCPARLVSCSIASTLKEVLLSLRMLYPLKQVESGFLVLHTHLYVDIFLMFTTHFTVSMNALLNIKGIFISKSTGKVNWRTLIKTSSTTPYSLIMEWSAS